MMVVCTGKGSHRELDLHEFANGAMRASGSHSMEIEYAQWWQPFGYWAPAGSDKPIEGTLRFQCRRCGRDTRLTASRLSDLFDGLRRADVFVLDVSYLPY